MERAEVVSPAMEAATSLHSFAVRALLALPIAWLILHASFAARGWMLGHWPLFGPGDDASTADIDFRVLPRHLELVAVSYRVTMLVPLTVLTWMCVRRAARAWRLLLLPAAWTEFAAVASMRRFSEWPLVELHLAAVALTLVWAVVDARWLRTEARPLEALAGVVGMAGVLSCVGFYELIAA